MGTPQDNRQFETGKGKSIWMLDDLEVLVNKAPHTPLRFHEIHKRFNIHPETLRRWALNHKRGTGLRRLFVNPRLEGQTTARALWYALDGRELPT